MQNQTGVTWFNAHLYTCLRSHRQGSSLALLSSAQTTNVLYTPCTKTLTVECLKSSIDLAIGWRFAGMMTDGRHNEEEGTGESLTKIESGQ